MASTSYQPRCWLTSYQKGAFWNRPLRIRPRRTEEGYKSKWERFMCYIFRVLALEPRQRRQIYNVPLRTDDIKMMHYLLGLALQLAEGGEDGDNESDNDEEEEDEDNEDTDGDDDDKDGSQDEGEEEDDKEDHSSAQSTFRPYRGTRLELSEALFQLSMMFWTYQSQDRVMASSTIIHFTAVMGVHRSSLAYRDAYNSTLDLAALIWVGRLFFLEYTLSLYSYETLAELVELKAFGKGIIRQEGPRGNLTWALGGCSFTIGDDKVVRLSEFCATYQAAIAQVRQLVAEMMLGWEPTVDLSTIRDDLTCRRPGWCILDRPENNPGGTYKSMACRAWSSSFRGQALAKAGHWLPGLCLAYLGAGVELTVVTMGFSASYVMAGLPGRGTETTSIRFRNTKLAIRNVFICEGRVIVIISYNKARALNNHAFYVVRYLPDDPDSSIFLYLAYIRPFLDFLANQLELPQYHSHEFLFPDLKHRKRHLTSIQTTAVLRSQTQDL
ncbi:hypothetical protein B0J13DRAFT_629804 [Dactylonectria estremocensis]|uniref:Uncharacterized protein n=1 Tax=Dactylonectria estremocensis TaxID=1079267 RepID=A0A9P9DFW8_9HYPO|nr:hypothetical protein B0J13DRAFT_629804 [Dactylonectria estremocensis]